MTYGAVLIEGLLGHRSWLSRFCSLSRASLAKVALLCLPNACAISFYFSSHSSLLLFSDARPRQSQHLRLSISYASRVVISMTLSFLHSLSPWKLDARSVSLLLLRVIFPDCSVKSLAWWRSRELSRLLHSATILNINIKLVDSCKSECVLRCCHAWLEACIVSSCPYKLPRHLPTSPAELPCTPHLQHLPGLPPLSCQAKWFIQSLSNNCI